MDKLEIFNQHRRLLFSIAYNMLGSVLDAEDMVQEVYIRWTNSTHIESPRAYLAAIMTNLCINHLQSAKVQREEYFGPWLPEPIVTESIDPHKAMELTETLSMTFLVMLENCTPHERAALLLRHVFDYEYSEIALTLDKSESACRQLVSRAKRSIAEHQYTSVNSTHSSYRRIATKFLEACITGDVRLLMNLLADDCVSVSDGGGKASTAIYPLVGADKVVQFLLGMGKKAPANSSTQIMSVNGLPGIVGYVAQQPVLVIAFEIMNGKIQTVYNVLNPDKLQRVPLLEEGGA